MLSKVMATLVATMAVAFAGYTYIGNSSGSKCCSGTMQLPTVSSESCCESTMPSCCQEGAAVVPEASCADVCPAEKASTAAKDKAQSVDGVK